MTQASTMNLPRLNEILGKLRSEYPELRTRYQLRSLGVFGSYVRGEQRKRSDLDMLVEFDTMPTLLQLAELQQVLSSTTGLKVDLALKHRLKPMIRPRILAEVIYL